MPAKSKPEGEDFEVDIPEEAEEVCDTDFGRVSKELLPDLRRRGRCLKCGHPVASHDNSAEQPAQQQSVVLQTQLRSTTEKQLDKLKEAMESIKSVRSSYKHPFQTCHPLDLKMLLRHADTNHLGFLGCPSLVVGDLPERPLRSLILTPWIRATGYAWVLELLASALSAALHVAVDGANVKAKDVMTDTPRAALEWSTDQVTELIRTLSCMA